MDTAAITTARANLSKRRGTRLFRRSWVGGRGAGIQVGEGVRWDFRFVKFGMRGDLMNLRVPT